MNRIFMCKFCRNIIVIGGFVRYSNLSLAIRGAKFDGNAGNVTIICEKCGGRSGQIELRKF